MPGPIQGDCRCIVYPVLARPKIAVLPLRRIKSWSVKLVAPNKLIIRSGRPIEGLTANSRINQFTNFFSPHFTVLL